VRHGGGDGLVGVSKAGCARREREPGKGSAWLMVAVRELLLLGLSSVAQPVGWKEAPAVHADLNRGGGGQPWVGAVVGDGGGRHGEEGRAPLHGESRWRGRCERLAWQWRKGC